MFKECLKVGSICWKEFTYLRHKLSDPEILNLFSSYDIVPPQEKKICEKISSAEVRLIHVEQMLL